MMAKLYGIGTGPGDWELMTLKAVRVIRECGVIAVPASGGRMNAAYDTAKQAVPEMDEKNIIRLRMPMTRDDHILKEARKEAAGIIMSHLGKGESVAFLTLGDPSVYSTYMYIHEMIEAEGWEAEMIPGIPSFCAVSARLGQSLTEPDMPLHIIPASYDVTGECMRLPGNKVFMKSGKHMAGLKEALAELRGADIKAVENCGMKNERVYMTLEDIDEKAGYFSTVIVREKGEKK